MHSIIKDIQYGIRNLFKRPGYTAIALLTLALGIGANTAIFSLVSAVLLRPLQVPHPEQLVEVYGTLHNGADDTIQSYLNYKDYRDRNRTLSGLMAYRFVPVSISQERRNERAWGYLVSGNYFEVLGVQPFLGRYFQPDEDKTLGTSPVAVISYGCWQKRFASDTNAVGKQLSINGRSFTVIGVAPKDFCGTEIAFAPELFVPMMMAHEIEPGSNWIESRGDSNIFVVGRLRPGVTSAQAESDLKAITLDLAKEYPNENEGRSVRLATPGLFIPDIRNSVIGFSTILMGVVALVLLLACVNLANLLLARATERRKELAIRLAVGASRARVIRQLVTESVLLSLIGGLGGVLIAAWISDAVAAIKLPTDIALVFDLRLDWRVLGFALIVSLITGIVFSLLPALQSSNLELVPALKDQTSLGGFRKSRLRNALVVVQVALSLVLLVCAGLVVRSLQNAKQTRPGFTPENAIALSFDLGLQGYTEEKGRAFHRQLLERTKSIPGVRSAALTSVVPLTLDYSSTSIYVEGQPFTGSSDLPLAIPNEISPDYFRTMEIPLRGRDFAEREDKPESRVAIVNETFARKFFPGQEAIGRRFNFSGPDKPYWQVIGVAADGKYNSLSEDPKAAFYRPLLRDYSTNATLVARTNGDSSAALTALRGELAQMDATLPLFNVETLSEHMNVPLFPFRMAATVLGSFGILAIVLAAIGVYGVMSYVVAGRTREMGVRIALGAKRRDVMFLIVKQGMLLTVMGLGVGLVVALGVTQLLTKILFGVGAFDPLTFLAVCALLAAVAALSSYLPARRATKVDPLVALRYE
jgi:predicted permease